MAATDDQRFLALQMAHTEAVAADRVIERATTYLEFLMDDPSVTVQAKKEQDKKPDQSLPSDMR